MSFKVGLLINNEPCYLQRRFDYDDTILSIKEEYYNTESNSQPVSNIKLVHNGVHLQNDKTIEYYDDDVVRSFLCVLTFTASGGSKLKSESKEEQKENTKKKYKIGLKIHGRKRVLNARALKKLKTSKKQCELYGDNGTNIVMPCGHIYGPEALFDIGHNLFAKNRFQTKIICPNKCKKDWPFKYWSRGACLYDDEYDAIFSAIQTRLAPETKKCPNCGNPNEKPDSLRMLRIACKCHKGDWCWYCAKKWVGGGFTVCGNSPCPSEEINNTLQKCPTKNLGANYGNIVVPTYRACPKCYTLIEHTSACKHMICRNPKCKHNFCFSCLKPKNDNGTWPCKEYYFACPAAKRQTLK